MEQAPVILKFVPENDKKGKEEHFFIGSFWFLTPVSTGVLFLGYVVIVRIIYTILFFVNTLLLLLLTYTTVQFLDQGANYYKIGLMAFAIVICIFMLSYLLFRYIKIPSDGKEF